MNRRNLFSLAAGTALAPLVAVGEECAECHGNHFYGKGGYLIQGNRIIWSSGLAPDPNGIWLAGDVCIDAERGKVRSYLSDSKGWSDERDDPWYPYDYEESE